MAENFSRIGIIEIEKVQRPGHDAPGLSVWDERFPKWEPSDLDYAFIFYEMAQVQWYL